jgi:hypothetical protein
MQARPDKSAIRLVVKQRSANDVQEVVKSCVVQMLSTTLPRLGLYLATELPEGRGCSSHDLLTC